MKTQEAAALLAVAAAYDNRKPDADAAQAWALVLDGLRFEDCRDAIVQHYRRGHEWLMPDMVIAGVKRIREKRLASVVEPPPPPELTPAETIAWLRDIRRRIADGEQIEPTELDAPARDVIAELGQVGQQVPPMNHTDRAAEARKMLRSAPADDPEDAA